MTLSMIAYSGFARAGKDCFAEPLIRQGWRLQNYGHVIKQFFSAYIAAQESAGDLFRRLQEANPRLEKWELDRFMEEVILPFEEADLITDAFTEHDGHKSIIRPILEKGGDLIYDWVSTEYFRQVDEALSRGERVVNTRLVRIPEAQEWVRRGGVIYVIERRDHLPASDWERDALATLKASGLVADTLYNHGTAADWQKEAELFARDLHLFARKESP